MAINKDQIFSFLKKNGWALGALAVALAAAAVPFFVSDGIAKQLKSDLEGRASEGASLETLVKNQRSLPKLDPDAKDADPLKVFPSDAVIKVANNAVEEFKKNVNELLEGVVKMNRQPPLVGAALPGPLKDSAQPLPRGGLSQGPLFEFRDAYRDAFLNNLVKVKLNAGVAPTQAEIAEEVATAKARLQQEKAVRVNSVITNQPEIDALLMQEDQNRPNIVRQRIAEKHSIYVSPLTFRVEPIIEQQDAPTYERVWYAQVGYWLQSQIADAVAEMNKGSQSVYTSPIKHLVKIDFSPQFITGSTSKGVTGEDPAAAITPDKRVSHTGHVSNGLYDVLHFRLLVRMSESKVPDFLRVLGNNRLMTVLAVDVTAVDSVTAAREGYVYGAEPVVELRVQAEALFLRKWTKPLMPQVIREGFGVVPKAAP